MENPFYTERGPWVPLPRPIDLPSDDVLSEPFVTVSFNETWLPAVVSSFSSLARPESYNSDDPETLYSMAQQGAQLPFLVDVDPCPADCSPVTIQGFEGLDGHTNTPGVSQLPQKCDGCGSLSRIWAFHLRLDTFTDLADVCLRFRSVADNSPVGIEICDFRASVTDGTIGNVWNLAWKDCLGDTNGQIGAGGTFLKQNFIAKEVALSSLGAFMLTITVVGEIQCGVA